MYVKSNHLGNVLVTISDRRLQIIPALSGTSGVVADLLSASDYYGGGMLMPGRVFNSNTYRYGYNKGSEKDDEISGVGNHFVTFYREGDTRLLTWWGGDPKPNASLSPYSYMNGNPVTQNDEKGDKPGEGEGDDKCVTCGKKQAKPELNPAGNDNLSGHGTKPKEPIAKIVNNAKISADTRTDHVRQLDQTYTNFKEGDSHWFFKIPVVGSATQAGRRAAYGEYAGAASSFSLALIEGFSFGSANSAVASKYLTGVGQIGNFASVEGFSLNLGGAKFFYNSSLNAASNGKWFTSTAFATSGEAYTKLALGYPRSLNFAQEVYKARVLGLSVKGTAASQGIGVSTGGGIQYMGVFFKKSNMIKVGF